MFGFRSKAPNHESQFEVETRGNKFVVRNNGVEVDRGQIINRDKGMGLPAIRCMGNRFKSFELVTWSMV